MRQINHPSIVKLISFSESDEHYFLVLERELIPRIPLALYNIVFSTGGWRVVPSNVLVFSPSTINLMSLVPQRQANLLQRKLISTRHSPSGKRNPLFT